MILIDTNVLSAVSKVNPDTVAIEWLRRQERESIWTTTVTVYEVRFGIESLPAGRKRSTLEERFIGALREDLEGRILPFDLAAAESAASLAARRRRAGRPIEVRDTQIAGIALSRGARLATRNVRHFDDLGIDLINPWSST